MPALGSEEHTEQNRYFGVQRPQKSGIILSSFGAQLQHAKLLPAEPQFQLGVRGGFSVTIHGYRTVTIPVKSITVVSHEADMVFGKIS